MGWRDYFGDSQKTSAISAKTAACRESETPVSFAIYANPKGKVLRLSARANIADIADINRETENRGELVGPRFLAALERGERATTHEQSPLESPLAAPLNDDVKAAIAEVSRVFPGA